MPGSFFDLAIASEPWRSDAVFYLRDRQDKTMAFSYDPSFGSASDADAVVSLTGKIRFAPIDFNPIYDGIAPVDEERCDGMLFSKTHKTIVFVELKDRSNQTKLNNKAWRKKAISQLHAVVKRFKEVEAVVDAMSGSVHRAYAANKQGSLITNPAVKYNAAHSIASQERAFMHDPETFGFRLVISNQIKLGVVV